MINTIPKEVMNEVQRIRSMATEAKSLVSTVIPLVNFTIELDKYNNMWYYRSRGGKKTLIWRVFASNDGELSFEFFQSNQQINPWMVNFHKQKELFYLEKNNKKSLNDDLSDD
jgi:hypothetical protein